MQAAKKIPIDELREHLLYDPITGIFTRKRQIKRPLGFVNDRGYFVIEWRNSSYRAHRIAWVWMYGESDLEIDHINGIKLDNRIVNLREATSSENNRNTKLRSSNSSGIKGVWWDKRGGKWQAEILLHGIMYYVGRFDCINQARKALMIKREELHGEFANHG